MATWPSVKRISKEIGLILIIVINLGKRNVGYEEINDRTSRRKRFPGRFFRNLLIKKGHSVRISTRKKITLASFGCFQTPR